MDVYWSPESIQTRGCTLEILVSLVSEDRNSSWVAAPSRIQLHTRTQILGLETEDAITVSGILPFCSYTRTHNFIKTVWSWLRIGLSRHLGSQYVRECFLASPNSKLWWWWWCSSFERRRCIWGSIAQKLRSRNKLYGLFLISLFSLIFSW